MSEEKTDWNAYFAERMAEHKKERAKKLAEAKKAAEGTTKEPFDRVRFEELYRTLAPASVTEHTPWETLFSESEYEYYVNYPDQKTLAEYIEHQEWEDGYS